MSPKRVLLHGTRAWRSPPLHTVPVVRDLLPLGGLSEHEEVFVVDQVEVVLGAGSLLPRGLHLVLDLEERCYMFKLGVLLISYL